MAGFLKDWDYEEEKGASGLIWVFFGMLIVFETIIGFIILSQSHSAFYLKPDIFNIFKIFTWAYIGFILFTCLALLKIKKYAVNIVKVFLCYRVVFLITAFMIIFSTEYYKKAIRSAIGSQITSIKDISIPFIIYIVAFSVLWFIYFIKSKRVKKTYNVAD